MKTALYKIVFLLLFMSLCTELAYSYFHKQTEEQMLITGKTEPSEKKADDLGDEKEDFKDKSQPASILFKLHAQAALLHHSFHSYYTQAYQSLPEIPPELV
jgi:Tfp pilus assembly protein PilO